MEKTKKQSEEQFFEDADLEHQLILYNDEVNSFDHVINCLIEICRHNREQAEQCAWLVHNKGKYAVKKGSFDELKIMCKKLSVEGLTATVE